MLNQTSIDTNLFHQLLTHKTLLKGEELHLPFVRLLGVLLCASTKRMKAESFYQIVTGHNPLEKREVTTSQDKASVGVDSEAHASDIFIDPLIFRSSENLV